MVVRSFLFILFVGLGLISIAQHDIYTLSACTILRRTLSTESLKAIPWVQFRSVQISSVQFRSVQFSSVQFNPSSIIASERARMPRFVCIAMCVRYAGWFGPVKGRAVQVKGRVVPLTGEGSCVYH